MLGDFDFSICVIARHSDADMSDLAMRLGRPPVHTSRKGEQIVTPKGRRLTGTYPDSRCLVELASNQDGTLAECVERAAELLEPHRDFFQQVRGIGGSVELFAKWYPNGDTGESFPPELLAKLGSMGLSLGFNVYGVDPSGSAESSND
jgi:hypothetical protein